MDEYVLIRESGERVSVRVAPPRVPLDDDEVNGSPMFAGRMLHALQRGHVTVDSNLEEWELRDFHLLRDLAERLGVIAADPIEERCRNCSAEFRVDPRGAPLEPLLERRDPPDPLPERLAQPVDGVEGLSLSSVNVARARPFWAALGAPELILDARIIQAMGVDSLTTARGVLSDPKRLASRIREGSELLWDVVQAAYDRVNYPLRASVPHRCEACDTIHDVPSPSTRETWVSPRALSAIDGGEGQGEFPSPEEFGLLADALRDEIYDKRGIAEIPLIVDFGVPPVDGSGEPLMGCYVADDLDPNAADPFQIFLYYETFRRMFEDFAYDVDLELYETIDHEVEHHLHHLAGHDPMHEEELREVDRDLERTYGSRSVAAEHRAEQRRLWTFLVVGVLVVGGFVALGVALGFFPE